MLSSAQVARGQPRDQIAVALGNIHRQLVRIVGNDPRMADLHNESDIALDRANLAKSNQPIIDSHDTNQSESAPMAEGFNGEPSIAHLLHEMEGHLQELGMARSLTATPPTNQPLTPTRGQCRAERNIDCTQVALDAHGIIPNRDKWNILLNTFLNEVHVLYPFLHLPILRSTYEGLCDRLLMPSSAVGEGKSQRIKISQVLFCLATGQCSESSRKETEDGRHSAGWSLFQAGMDILGNPLDVFDDFSISLDGLQAMILAVRLSFPV